jgi:hypothetical protein
MTVLQMPAISPVDQLAPMLRMIPSLPRPILDRLVARMIERLDHLDGDPDLESTGEDDEDTYDREQEQGDV